MRVSYEFYTQEFLGTDIKEDDWTKYEDKAEELIDTITRWTIPSDISSLDERTQKLIKKAICYQADYFMNNGLDVGFTDDNSFTVGKVSVSDSGDSEDVKRAKRVCGGVRALLEQTGYLNRGVCVC